MKRVAGAVCDEMSDHGISDERKVADCIENLSTRQFPATASYGRRLVRLGAQLCSADGELIARDFARADLPNDIGPGASADVVVQLPALATPGRYRIKLDLVNEGVDWFERCGSEPTERPLWGL